MSRPGTQSSLQRPAHAQVVTPEASRSSTASCKIEDDLVVVPPLRSADFGQSSQSTLHAVDPDAWSMPQIPLGLEQLNGHDLMAMFPTQAPMQLVCCDDIFKSQAREFLSRQGPPVDIQESPATSVEETARIPLTIPPVTHETRTYAPRHRRVSKNDNYTPPLTRRPLHRN
ncbi:hypothetical protein BDW22DRAFT_1361553 [Trametopsis cervina]|nr:hypothetical protein BDW22DRAFT_1361553 [Trametopsis cervina]